jgi:outer membrane protein assembly factor BamE
LKPEYYMYMFKRLIPTLIPLLLFLAGCSYEGTRKLPFVYRVDIQQGNVIDQDMVDLLRPGMDKNQVQYIMGTPVLDDPFHTNRWDYIYTYSKGGARREQRHIILYFKNNKLASVGGDVEISQRKASLILKEPSRTVVVPPDYNKKSLLRKMINHIPFVGDDDARPAQRDSRPDSDGDEAGE